MLGSTFLLHGELSLAVAGAGAAAHPEDDGRHHSDCMRCRSQLCVGHMLFFQSAPPLTRAAMEIPFCNGASEEVRRNCGSSSSRSSSSSNSLFNGFRRYTDRKMCGSCQTILLPLVLLSSSSCVHFVLHHLRCANSAVPSRLRHLSYATLSLTRSNPSLVASQVPASLVPYPLASHLLLPSSAVPPSSVSASPALRHFPCVSPSLVALADLALTCVNVEVNDENGAR